jgi:cell division protein FtsW
VPAAPSASRPRASVRPRSEVRRAGAAGPPDALLTVVVLALVSFGLVMVYSSSSATALLNEGNPMGLLLRQLAYALVGLGAYFLFARMSPAGLRRLGPPSLAVAAALLLLVLVPGFGMEVNGSRRWISLGSLGQVQPSELAKLALALWLAQAVARDPARLRTPRGAAPFLLVAAGLAGLVLMEPDLGTAVVLAGLALTMLFVAGTPGRALGAVVGGAAALAAVAVMSADYRRERFLAFLDPWSDPGGSGFQAVQAQVALGAGGLTGRGLGEGVQKAFYLPEAHTDMILATVGEELGLIGVVAVLAGFALFALAGYRIALGARDLHQQVLAAGLTTLVVAQAVVNVGAVVGVLPMKGMPLPFVSFGGSNLIVLLACTGILVNIGRRSHAQRRRLAPAASADEGGDRGGRHGRPRDAGLGGGRRAAGARG